MRKSFLFLFASVLLLALTSASFAQCANGSCSTGRFRGRFAQAQQASYGYAPQPAYQYQSCGPQGCSPQAAYAMPIAGQVSQKRDSGYQMAYVSGTSVYTQQVSYVIGPDGHYYQQTSYVFVGTLCPCTPPAPPAPNPPPTPPTPPPAPTPAK